MQTYLFNQFVWLKTLSFKYKLLSCNGQAATKPKHVAFCRTLNSPRMQALTGVPRPGFQFWLCPDL